MGLKGLFWVQCVKIHEYLLFQYFYLLLTI